MSLCLDNLLHTGHLTDHVLKKLECLSCCSLQELTISELQLCMMDMLCGIDVAFIYSTLTWHDFRVF